MEIPAPQQRAGRWSSLSLSMFSQSQSQSVQGDGRALTEEDLADVEEQLQELANSLMEQWDLRQQQTSLEVAAFAAFTEEFDWGRDTGKVGHPELSSIHVLLTWHTQVQDEGVNADVDAVEHLVKLKQLLVNLVAQLPGQQSDNSKTLTSCWKGTAASRSSRPRRPHRYCSRVITRCTPSGSRLEIILIKSCFILRSS